LNAPYVPPHFEEWDVARLHAAMRDRPFGTIVVNGADGLIASHVPILVETEPAPYGALLFHVARPNPQWRAVAAETEALAIFLGPHAYISPSWYATTRETGKVVPTWNYLAIHAYGPLEVFEDAASLRELVTRLTAIHERGQSNPWAPSDAPEDYIATQLRAIVGLRMPIRRLYGKWKMSQNRPDADRSGAMEALEKSDRAEDRAVAAIMRSRNAGGG
jgi:transcriptional regulator